MDKFEKMYEWIENPNEFKRTVPDNIYNDRQKGLFYNVDVAIRGVNGLFKIYEDSSPIICFMGPEPIAYWRRSINSYQASFEFGVEQ